jgi:hypothetical protein
MERLTFRRSIEIWKNVCGMEVGEELHTLELKRLTATSSWKGSQDIILTNDQTGTLTAVELHLMPSRTSQWT